MSKTLGHRDTGQHPSPRGAGFRATFRAALCATLHAQAAPLVSPETDLAGNRLEALAMTDPAKATDTEQGCTADKAFCITLTRGNDDQPAAIEMVDNGAPSATYRFDLPSPEDGNGDLGLWPGMLRLAGQGGVVVGVAYRVQTGYSGGGGSATSLRLFHLTREGNAFQSRETLAVPIDGSLMIRACFSERDMRRRLGACHDEYSFSASLHLDRAVKAGPPRLLYATHATSFPGKVSRDSDSLANPPLRKRDLVRAVDPACTYRRVFQIVPSTGVYAPDKPLPDCENYTVP